MTQYRGDVPYDAEQGADMKHCDHRWQAESDETGGFRCLDCDEQAWDANQPLPCPACGETPEVLELVQVRCKNWGGCAMHPRVTGAERHIALSKWNSRLSGENANRWMLYERKVDTETGEVT